MTSGSFSDQRLFNATVVGASDDSLRWSASSGTIIGEGTTITFVAPAGPGTVSLTVTSNADSRAQATAVVSVVAAEVSDVSVRLTPGSADLAHGQEQPFTATVTGSSNPAVTWSVSCGTVTESERAGNERTVTYTAPDEPATCELRATSDADPTQSATASIDVTSVGISIDPSSVSLLTGQSQVFTATVAGSEDASVSWEASCGSVDATADSADYTAPADAGTCELTATSQADPTKTATATITVTAVGISIEPEAASLAQGQRQSFTATVAGTSNVAVSWEASCGSVEGTGATVEYTAPNEAGTCQLTASSEADPTKRATAIITVSGIGVSIEPSRLESFLGQTSSVGATVVGSADTSVSWSLSAADCGDISGTGNTISYTAPNRPPATECTLTASSNAKPEKRATIALSHHAAPSVGLRAIPASVAPGEPLVFDWSLSNPSQTLPLTCELRAAAGSIDPTYTIADCGRSGHTSSQSHVYPDAGDYTASLTVRQGDDTLRTVTTTVRVAHEFVHVSAGAALSLALDSHGRAWAWGRGTEGQLGNGGTDDQATPVAVSMPEGVTFTTVRAGAFHAVALDSEGRAWAWGSGNLGRLGNGDTSGNQTTPVAISMPAGVTFTAVSANRDHALALDSEGRAWAWGYGSHGRLGVGSIVAQATPAAVSMPPGVTFTAVSAGHEHSLAVDSSGRAWAWGRGTEGQLGNGATDDQLSPVAVDMPDGVTFAVVSAGGAHSLALDNGGRAWAWGSGGAGRLGNGSTTNQTIPVAVSMPPGETFSTVSAGGQHSLALDRSGSAWAWGRGEHGRLGIGIASDRDSPAPIKFEGVTITNVSAGRQHSLATDRDNAAWAWGSGDAGRLGNGSSDDQVTPVRVTPP